MDPDLAELVDELVSAWPGLTAKDRRVTRRAIRAALDKGD
jgi:hypothetical protein